MRQSGAAIRRLASPDRQHDLARHAEFALDARQRVAMLGRKF
jgi:hypothetical protein